MASHKRLPLAGQDGREGIAGEAGNQGGSAHLVVSRIEGDSWEQRLNLWSNEVRIGVL